MVAVKAKRELGKALGTKGTVPERGGD